MKVNKFFKSIYPNITIKNIENKFLYLSYDKKNNINLFLGLRLSLSILVFILSLFITELKKAFFFLSETLSGKITAGLIIRCFEE